MKQDLVYLSKKVFEILVVSAVCAMMLYLEPTMNSPMTHRILSKLGIAGLSFPEYLAGTGFITSMTRVFTLSFSDGNSQN